MLGVLIGRRGHITHDLREMAELKSAVISRYRYALAKDGYTNRFSIECIIYATANGLTS